MRPRDLAELVALSAVWGASFLFMRIAAPSFGALALAGLRVAIAAAFLVPVMLWMKRSAALGQHFWTIALVGLFNSAIPFALFAWATHSVTAGFASILNATTPFWAAAVAWAWLGDRLGRLKLAGLITGFAGVVWLSVSRSSFAPQAAGWAIAACLGATLCYGIAASMSKRFLPGVDPVATAAGSQLGSALALVPLAIWTWPEAPIQQQAWAAMIGLGVLCTGLAYISYFRLMNRIGPAKTVTVTFIVPIFGVLWGVLFLGEMFTLPMAVGSAVILLGTALTTGLWAPLGMYRAAKSRS
jgi:drug/metabolite transporter (DMT)-like permease